MRGEHGAEKGLDLVLRPGSGEEGDEGGFAAEERGGIAGGSKQGAALQVGEVERFVGTDERGGREETFAWGKMLAW